MFEIVVFRNDSIGGGRGRGKGEAVFPHVSLAYE
jgi:hypothetical protein